VEKIAETCEGKARVGFRRSGGHNAQPLLLPHVQTGEPERRFPDPRLTLEYERSVCFVRAPQKGVNCRELALPPDDLARHGRNDGRYGDGRQGEFMGSIAVHGSTRPLRVLEDGRHRATRHGPVDRSLYLPSASTAQPIGSDLDRLAA
jgi:hypothetical protein